MGRPPNGTVSRRVQAQANAFRVWQVATAAGWSVTAREIAEETGLSIRSVRAICGSRGWRLQARSEDDEPVPVDEMMQEEMLP